MMSFHGNGHLVNGKIAGYCFTDIFLFHRNRHLRVGERVEEIFQELRNG